VVPDATLGDCSFARYTSVFGGVHQMLARDEEEKFSQTPIAIEQNA
jgi:hypothetical protein